MPDKRCTDCHARVKLIPAPAPSTGDRDKYSCPNCGMLENDNVESISQAFCNIAPYETDNGKLYGVFFRCLTEKQYVALSNALEEWNAHCQNRNTDAAVSGKSLWDMFSTANKAIL